MERLEIIGSIGKDAETKEIKGKKYASFSVAVNDKKRDKTVWYNVMKSDESGNLTPHLTSGKQLFISGTPTVSAYMNKEEKPQASITIWSNTLQLLSGGEKKQEQKEEERKPYNQNLPDLKNEFGQGSNSNDDDLPF